MVCVADEQCGLQHCLPSMCLASELQSPHSRHPLIVGSYEWVVRICVLLAPGKYDGLGSWTHWSQT